jgi:hypothetical protein
MAVEGKEGGRKMRFIIEAPMKLVKKKKKVTRYCPGCYFGSIIKSVCWMSTNV